jgi:hypothetical protein
MAILDETNLDEKTDAAIFDEWDKLAKYSVSVSEYETAIGVHFTQAGGRKLAHFVEREIDRWLSARAATVALPVEETKAAAPAAPEVAAGAATGKAGAKARPLAGPAVPWFRRVSSPNLRHDRGRCTETRRRQTRRRQTACQVP